MKKTDANYKESLREEVEIFKEEEEISQELFNKRYSDIKHTLYTPGNEEMRNKFLEALKKKKNVRHDNDYHEEKVSRTTNTAYATSASPSDSGNTSAKMFGILILCGLGLIPFVAGGSSNHTPIVDKPEHKVKDYT